MVSRILSNLPRWLAPAALALGLVACGGGGGSMSGGGGTPQGCSASTCGNALLTLTDAAGDFASYAVDVSSLKLTKADGTVVETLPTKTRVDFAQLVNVTEFLTSAMVPQGDYVAATMTLDYSNAAIFVYADANNTQTVQVAQVVDNSNNTLWSATPPPPANSTIALTVQLDNKNHLSISPGRLARLALDFNLTASNSVSLANPAAPVVTVQPFIVASVVPTDNKEIRVRGALVSADVGAETYTINVEPFDDEGTNRGQVVVHTTAQTSFEIDGVAYTGDAGLTALNADPAGTMTVAFGTLSTSDHSFTASRVLGGSSVETNSLDRLQGVVISRSGNTLVVRGGSLWQHADDQDHFSVKDVTLTIADTTKITVAGEAPGTTATPVNPLSLPSVGSRVTAFGKAGTDGSGNPTFDASSGRLRLELTTLWGTAVQIGTGSVTLNLQSIEGRAASVFNFAGTGTTSAQDSNPTSYVVTTGTLPLTTLSTAAPLRFFGLVQPFGSAPPDFNARTLVDFAGTSALLEAGFGGGSTAAITASAANLVLNVSDPLLGAMHFIRIGPRLVDLKTLTSNLTIAPAATSTGPFAIHTEVAGGMGQPDTIAVFNTFADFETALAAKLTAGGKVLKVFALGQYDSGTNTLTAAQIALDVM
jgi:hypothetical protein